MTTYAAVEVRDDGTVHIPGHGFGRHLVQERRIGDNALWIYRGHAWRDGIGSRSKWFPTHYMLIRWVGPRRVEVVEEIEPGRKWRSVKQRMLHQVYSGIPLQAPNKETTR